jgi:hypothetical protein
MGGVVYPSKSSTALLVHGDERYHLRSRKRNAEQIKSIIEIIASYVTSFLFVHLYECENALKNPMH